MADGQILSTLNVFADLIIFEMDAAKPACCELVKEAEESNENTQQNRLKPQLLESLPVNIKKGQWQQQEPRLESQCSKTKSVFLCQCCVTPAERHTVLVVCSPASRGTCPRK